MPKIKFLKLATQNFRVHISYYSYHSGYEGITVFNQLFQHQLYRLCCETCTQFFIKTDKDKNDFFHSVRHRQADRHSL